jgi:hypothetical protein
LSGIQSLFGDAEAKKKASFFNEALKGSLNLMVSKGPEETIDRKLNSNGTYYLRVFPWMPVRAKKL